MPDFYLIEDSIRRAFIDESVRQWEWCNNLWFW